MDPHRKPPIGKRIINFSKAVIKHTKDGLQVVSDEVKEKRLEKCSKCEYRDGTVCNHEDCGCVLAIKVQWASESCPIGEWGIE
jgi:hypothetical protein